MVSRIGEEFAKGLVKRLRSLPFDGDDDDATGRRREVGLALIQSAESEEHASSIVDHIIRNSKHFPVPAEVYALCQSIKTSQECERCGGTGWVTGGNPCSCVRCRKCSDTGWLLVPEGARRCACVRVEVLA